MESSEELGHRIGLMIITDNCGKQYRCVGRR
jgi:hypothetical protein